MSIPRLLFIGLIVPSLLAGPVQAADEGLVTMSVEVSGFDAPLVPVTGVTDLTAVVTIGCDSPADVGDGVVTAEAEGPTWATLQVTPVERALALNATDCVQGTKRTAEFQVDVRLSHEAPAFAPIPVKVHAAYRGTNASGEAVGTVGLITDLQARFVKTVYKTGPGSSISLPLEVENKGNAVVEITAAPAEVTSRALDVEPPEAFLVPIGGTSSQLVVVKVPADLGYMNEQHQVALRFTAVPADDPDAEAWNATSTAVIQVQGLSGGSSAGGAVVGGFAIVLVVAVIAVIVLLVLKRPSS